MQKLLYFYADKASFVSSDLNILNNNYTSSSFYFNPSPKLLTPFILLYQFFYLSINVASANILFSQFSGYHSFFPSLFGKLFNIPHYIVLHGTDCNNFPEYNYGYLNKPWLYWFSKKSLQWATKLLPVSEALVSTRYVYTNTKYANQGFKHFYKNLTTPWEVIYNGISKDSFYINQDGVRQPKSFITVATGLNAKNRRTIKGIDFIIELAKLTPEYSYTFVGASEPVDLDLPSNINLVGYISNTDLVHFYNKNSFYLQLSLTEGFGISVCEAMLCGCIPIVSNVGILPFIAGPNGYVLNRKNMDLLLDTVNTCINNYSHSHCSLVREHIINHFLLEARAKKLITALKK